MALRRGTTIGTLVVLLIGATSAGVAYYVLPRGHSPRGSRKRRFRIPPPTSIRPRTNRIGPMTSPRSKPFIRSATRLHGHVSAALHGAGLFPSVPASPCLRRHQVHSQGRGRHAWRRANCWSKSTRRTFDRKFRRKKPSSITQARIEGFQGPTEDCIGIRRDCPSGDRNRADASGPSLCNAGVEGNPPPSLSIVACRPRYHARYG